MTMIASVAFPEGIVVLSDSRVTYINSVKPPEDKLKKVFQLQKNILIAFTSSNVALTWKMLERMTIKAKILQNLTTSDFIFQISEYAKQVYDKESKNKDDVIEFIYSGLDFKTGTKIKSTKLKRLIDKYNKSGGYENKFSKAQISSKKNTIIPPPSVLLAKQVFPSGKIIFTRGWDFGTAGSGKSFIDDLEKYYPKIFRFGTLFEKAIMIKNLCDDYIRDASIEDIGGFVQVFMLSEDNGVEPLAYEEKVNNIPIKRRYCNLDGEWIEEDLKTGKISRVIQNF